MKDKRLATIFAVVFVDLLGFSLILPLLPYYAEKYGATPAVVGLLVASYALAQLIGAPLWAACLTATAGARSCWSASPARSSVSCCWGSPNPSPRCLAARMLRCSPYCSSAASSTA